MDFSVLTINLKMKNVSDKSCRKHQNVLCVQYIFSKIVPCIKICGKNVVEPERPQMTV
jgi:hypothetical protein